MYALVTDPKREPVCLGNMGRGTVFHVDFLLSKTVGFVETATVGNRQTSMCVVFIQI